MLVLNKDSPSIIVGARKSTARNTKRTIAEIKSVEQECISSFLHRRYITHPESNVPAREARKNGKHSIAKVNVETKK